MAIIPKLRNSLTHLFDRWKARKEYRSLYSGDPTFGALKWQGPGRPKVLFVTSNGAGMGHLTRCMAIAGSGRSRFDSAFVTLSSSAPILADFGFPYVYFRSHKATGLSARRWNVRFEMFMREVLRSSRFDAVVFDGTWIYRGLLAALKTSQTEMIWLRRGLWKESALVDQLESLRGQVVGILTPEDIADGTDTGPLASRTDMQMVSAITLTDEDDLMDRQGACKELGLPAEHRYVLVQLGAGNINNIDSARDQVVFELQQLNPDLKPVIAVSPLAISQQAPPGIEYVLQRYPLAPYLRAFDFVVGAAGYNSIHELARFGVPALIIPNVKTSTDNQELRAQAFEKGGWGFAAGSLPEIREGLRKLVRGSGLDARMIGRQNTNFDSGESAASAIASLIRKQEK